MRNRKRRVSNPDSLQYSFLPIRFQSSFTSHVGRTKTSWSLRCYIGTKSYMARESLATFLTRKNATRRNTAIKSQARSTTPNHHTPASLTLITIISSMHEFSIRQRNLTRGTCDTSFLTQHLRCSTPCAASRYPRKILSPRKETAIIACSP